MIEREIPDETIVLLILEGQIELFRDIVDRYQGQIFRMGMYFFRNSEDASDFLQEVFIQVYTKLDTYKQLSPFKFWILKIAYNLGISKTRISKPSVSLNESLLEESVACNESPESSLEISETQAIINKAINELPEKYRICIEMYFYEDLKYAEISQITGFPINTVKSHVFRAKQLLRDSLKKTIKEDDDEL
jgi:RNA polymerase sigma-70 factor (ECF subfamily)